MSEIKILIIDDHKTMRSIIRTLLQQFNIRKVQEAENGEDALNYFSTLAGAPEQHPDVIICDLHMEKMDGLEFVKNIRNGKSCIDSKIPILILTGDSTDLLKDVTLQVGATKVLQKPISAPNLHEEVKHAVGYCDCMEVNKA